MSVESWSWNEYPPSTQSWSKSYEKYTVIDTLQETLTDGVRFVVRKTQEALRWVFDGVESILEKAFK